MQMLYRLSYVGALDRNAPGGRRFLTLDAVPEFRLGPRNGF